MRRPVRKTLKIEHIQSLTGGHIGVTVREDEPIRQRAVRGKLPMSSPLRRVNIPPRLAGVAVAQARAGQIIDHVSPTFVCIAVNPFDVIRIERLQDAIPSRLPAPNVSPDRGWTDASTRFRYRTPAARTPHP